MSDMEKKDLKPCPFCGGQAKVVKVKEQHNGIWLDMFAVECQGEECYISTRQCKKAETMIKRWNRRVN